MTMRNLSVSLVPSPFMEQLLLAGEIDAIMPVRSRTPATAEGPRMHRSQDFQIPQWRSAHTTSERMFSHPSRDRDEPGAGGRRTEACGESWD